MKKAKQLLSLMLILVLALGMIPFAGATLKDAKKNVDEYNDFDDITQTEAVDVLSALGVLQGYEANNFAPTKDITRAEASKVIAYILLGTETADSLAHVTSSFSDVATTHWANPFIEYCVNKGIIAGYGNGKFGPDDKVTGTQMAKMLLMAVGYGANGEYTGSAWELNVIDRSRQLGVSILTGTGNVDYSAPATREAIAQYTFNALTIPSMVTWNSILNDYSSWSNLQQNGAQNPTLGTKTFGLTAVGARDGYGTGGREWTIGGTRFITGYYSTDLELSVTTDGTPITMTNNTTSKSLTDRGKTGYVAEFGTNLAGTPIFVNGREAVTAADRDDALRLANISGVTVKLLDEFGTAGYDGKIDRVVIIAKSVHEAAGAPMVSANGNVTIPGVSPGQLEYLRTAGSTYAPYTAPSNVLETITGLSRAAVNLPGATQIEYDESIADGDILLVHEKVVDGITVTVVEKAKTVAGQMTSAKSSIPKNITFAGSTYSESGLTPGVLFSVGSGVTYTPAFPSEHPFAETHLQNNAVANDNFNESATLWLDDNGDVIRALLDEGATPDYGLVISYRYDSVGLRGSAWVYMINSEGEGAVYDVAPDSNGIVPDQRNAIAAPVAANATSSTAYNSGSGGVGFFELKACVVGYTIDDNGEIKLYPLNDDGVAPAGDNSRSARQALTANYTANHSDVVINSERYHITANTAVFYYNFANGGTNNNGMYSGTSNPVYASMGTTGANEAVDSTTEVYYIRDLNADGTLSNTLTAIVFAKTNTAHSNLRWAFVTSTGFSSSEMVGATRVYDYKVYEDGMEITLKSVSPRLFANGVGLYSYRVNSSNGRVVAADTEALDKPDLITDGYGVQIRSATSGAGSIVWGATTPYDSYAVSKDTKYYQFSPSAPSATPNPQGGGVLNAVSTMPTVTSASTIQYRIWGIQETITGVAAAVYYEAYVGTPGGGTNFSTLASALRISSDNNGDIFVVGNIDASRYVLVGHSLTNVTDPALATSTSSATNVVLGSNSDTGADRGAASTTGMTYRLWIYDSAEGITGYVDVTVTAAVTTTMLTQMIAISNVAGGNASAITFANLNTAAGLTLGTDAGAAVLSFQNAYRTKIASMPSNSLTTVQAIKDMIATVNAEQIEALANSLKIVSATDYTNDALTSAGTFDDFNIAINPVPNAYLLVESFTAGAASVTLGSVGTYGTTAVSVASGLISNATITSPVRGTTYVLKYKVYIGSGTTAASNAHVTSASKTVNVVIPSQDQGIVTRLIAALQTAGITTVASADTGANANFTVADRTTGTPDTVTVTAMRIGGVNVSVTGYDWTTTALKIPVANIVDSGAAMTGNVEFDIAITKGVATGTTTLSVNIGSIATGGTAFITSMTDLMNAKAAFAAANLSVDFGAASTNESAATNVFGGVGILTGIDTLASNTGLATSLAGGTITATLTPNSGDLQIQLSANIAADNASVPVSVPALVLETTTSDYRYTLPAFTINVTTSAT